MIYMMKEKARVHMKRLHKGTWAAEGSTLGNRCGKKLVVEHGIIHREGSIGIDHAWDYFSEKDGQVHHFDL